MGQTLADIDKKIYQRYLNEGLTHEQIIKKIPSKFRKTFLENIGKSATEAHFGMKEKHLFMSIAVVMALAVALGLIFG